MGGLARGDGGLGGRGRGGEGLREGVTGARIMRVRMRIPSDEDGLPMMPSIRLTPSPPPTHLPRKGAWVGCG